MNMSCDWGQPWPRSRAYRIFYDTSKYAWRGPPLRAILKLVAPHQPLKLSADDMYFMTPAEVAPLLNSAYFSFFFCLFLGMDGRKIECFSENDEQLRNKNLV